MESLASGRVNIDQIVSPNFWRWVGSFALLRIEERPIEGSHARVSGLIRSAPNCGIPFISFGVRFPLLAEEVRRNPEAHVPHRPVFSGLHTSHTIQTVYPYNETMRQSNVISRSISHLLSSSYDPFSRSFDDLCSCESCEVESLESLDSSLLLHSIYFAALPIP